MTLPARRELSPLRRWDPLRELDDFHERMSQLMSSVFGMTPWMGERQMWTPLADVYETDDAYLVEVDLPGVKRDDVDVEVTGNELVITGEVKERERTGWMRSRTRRVGQFEYRTTLPQDVNADQISAELSEGVLTVQVPKSEAAKPRRIPISSK